MTPPADDYCELCDLPLSTCVHGRPPTPPAAVARPVAAPRARTVRARPAASRATSTAPPRRVPHRWTPPEEFRPHIFRVLQESGGRLEADDVMLELEVRLEDVLTSGDRERAPQGGDRWHLAVRKQRKALIDEGLLVPAQPGIWELTPKGRAATAD